MTCLVHIGQGCLECKGYAFLGAAWPKARLNGKCHLCRHGHHACIKCLSIGRDMWAHLSEFTRCNLSMRPSGPSTYCMDSTNRCSNSSLVTFPFSLKSKLANNSPAIVCGSSVAILSSNCCTKGATFA